MTYILKINLKYNSFFKNTCSNEIEKNTVKPRTYIVQGLSLLQLLLHKDYFLICDTFVIWSFYQ